MLTSVLKTPDPTFEWIDVVAPTADELAGLAAKYNLHQTSVQDCLDPSHLPKFEKIGEVLFIIARAYDDQCNRDADDVQELTRKIAVFQGPGFLITVHRHDIPFVAKLREKWGRSELPPPGLRSLVILTDLAREVLRTYDAPIESDFKSLEMLETQIFKGLQNPSVIEDAYYLKRHASVVKRMVRMSIDIVQKLQANTEMVSPLLHDLKDQGDGLLFWADELLEGTHNLLNLHISLSSQRTNEASHRTNEVMRVLTLFSVFFLPLNFIAGIYGMNFDQMPELRHPWGYPLALSGMFMVALSLFFWFRKRGWLK